MRELKAKLSAYGVNVAATMERFVGDEELYVTCLALFVDDPAFDTLQQALHEKAYAQAFDCAHSLKGVASNLGLTPLLAVLCPLVDSLRSQSYSHVEEQYQAIIAEQKRCKSLL